MIVALKPARWKLSGVELTSYQMNGSEGTQPFEFYSFAYSVIEFTRQTFNPAGTVKDTVTTAWDVVNNMPPTLSAPQAPSSSQVDLLQLTAGDSQACYEFGLGNALTDRSISLFDDEQEEDEVVVSLFQSFSALGFDRLNRDAMNSHDRFGHEHCIFRTTTLRLG